MKELFNADERYTEDACHIEDEVWPTIHGVFKKYIQKGYKIREIEYIIKCCVTEVSLNNVLDKKPTE